MGLGQQKRGHLGRAEWGIIQPPLALLRLFKSVFF